MRKNKKIKVAVAMSGGVDSGVVAGLLVRQGYECTGFHMRLWQEEVQSKSFENKCCSTESLEAARKTAHLLGMPFYTIDFEKIFKKKVVDYFLKEYAAGLTPNPCVMCNKYIKFGELLDYVRKLGYDYLATGHYSRVAAERDTRYAIRNTKYEIRNTRYAIRNTRYENTSRVSRITYYLLQAKDKSKDQSYFLYNLTQSQLAHILFPIGDYYKHQVREMAKKWGLPVAERPESQEICFFPETDYRPFLCRQIPEKIIPGEVVDTKGRVIGRHFGLPLYTIGQRHGFEIKIKNQKSNIKNILPYYVIGRDVKKNRLVVGFGKEAERKEFWVRNVNWIRPINRLQIKNYGLRVRIRHQGELLPARIQRLASRVKVILEEPERGIAPGQAAVFYHKEEVLGGGIIELDKKENFGYHMLVP